MDHAAVAAGIASQHAASLEMLRSAILHMPEELWDNPDHANRSWRIAYHALWGVRFYLAASPEEYVPWENAIEGAESLGGSWELEGAAVVDGVHTPEELIACGRTVSPPTFQLPRGNACSWNTMRMVSR